YAAGLSILAAKSASTQLAVWNGRHAASAGVGATPPALFIDGNWVPRRRPAAHHEVGRVRQREHSAPSPRQPRSPVRACHLAPPVRPRTHLILLHRRVPAASAPPADEGLSGATRTPQTWPLFPNPARATPSDRVMLALCEGNVNEPRKS